MDLEASQREGAPALTSRAFHRAVDALGPVHRRTQGRLQREQLQGEVPKQDRTGQAGGRPGWRGRGGGGLHQDRGVRYKIQLRRGRGRRREPRLPDGGPAAQRGDQVLQEREQYERRRDEKNQRRGCKEDHINYKAGGGQAGGRGGQHLQLEFELDSESKRPGEEIRQGRANDHDDLDVDDVGDPEQAVVSLKRIRNFCIIKQKISLLITINRVRRKLLR